MKLTTNTMTLAVKDKGGYYYAGMNKWENQLRKAKLYSSPYYAQEIVNSSRFTSRHPYMVMVRIEECGLYYPNN